jgi:hypothetical protein
LVNISQSSWVGKERSTKIASRDRAREQGEGRAQLPDDPRPDPAEDRDQPQADHRVDQGEEKEVGPGGDDCAPDLTAKDHREDRRDEHEPRELGLAEAVGDR